MSYLGCDNCTDLGYCEAIVKGIEAVNGQNNTSTRVTPVGTVQALFDPINLEGASYQEIQGSEGETRKVRVKRIPRGTSSEAVSTLSCDTSTTATYTEQMICVTEQASITFEVGLDELRAYCGDTLRVVNGGAGTPLFGDFVSKIMAKMNGLRSHIDENVIAMIFANAGQNIVTGNNTPTAVPMIQTLDGAKVEKGIQEIVHQMKENEVYGGFLAIGSGNFDRFNTSAQFGCCNQYGLNWGAMIDSAPYRYYTDVNVLPITTIPNLFFALAPGAVQFFFVNDTLVGKQNMDRRHGDSIYGLVPDPYLPGLNYDIAIQETNCSGGSRQPKWQISMYLQYGLAFIPDNAFGAGDRLRNGSGISNGVFLYEATSI